MDTEFLNDLLAESGFSNWLVIDDVTIECPCGTAIEWDGKCPEGHVSAIRSMGLI